MKRIFMLAMTAILFSTFSVNAWNLSDALKGLGKGDSSSSSGLASAIGNLLSTDKISVESLVGTWTYTAPAVTFKSENVLKKAGGAAASSMIEEKLVPIYKRTGFDKATLTVNSDSTFVLTANRIKLNGTISTVAANDNSQANFVFNFTLGGKMKVGKMNAYITKSATGTMSVMFDVTKLVTLMETVSKFSSNSTIKSAVNLLKSYDGLCAGFEMKKS